MNALNSRTFVRLGMGLAALTLGGASLPSGSVAAAPTAADSDVDVVNTETVQVYTDADGKIETKRLYEQLTLAGKGRVVLDNPIEEDGLRNLDDFSGVDTKDGKQHVDADVDGVERRRTVSDFKGDLPLEVDVDYKLDGKKVKAGDVVGEDGDLEVTYTVTNVTGEEQEISFPDGKGGMVTETVDVPIPMVGSLTTTLPESFTEVHSDQANMAGDGRGGTKMSFTMTLVPPIGTDTATFGYTAKIEDGVVPRASLSALPVNPLESPTFKSAATSYKGGADTGAELVAGATEIDSNLLKLRDGAGDLLAGLIQLSDGADQLNAGLSGEAAPGARKLANGAGELSDGLGTLKNGAGALDRGAGQLDDGADQLADGADRLSGGLGELDSGAGDLSSGAKRLAAGQKALAKGLKTMYEGVQLLPDNVQEELKSNVDYQTLLGALDKVVAGVGTRDDSPTAGTLLGGVNQIQYAMRFPGPNDCALALTGGTPTKCGAMDAVQLVANQLRAGAAGLPDGPRQQIEGAANALTGVYSKVDAQLLGAGAGLDLLRGGLSNGDVTNCAAAARTPERADDCGIKQAAQAVRAGVPVLVSTLVTNIQQTLLDALGKPTPGCDPKATLRCAAGALANGGGDLVAGVNTLVEGVTLLNQGGLDLSSGAGRLSAGLETLSAGTSELSAGAGAANDGAGQISEGAGTLADGLDEAADGSGRLAEGLEKAKTSAPALPEGANRLSKEGTKKLVAAGEATTQQYGKLYAIVEAGSKRANAGSMAEGAPENARGLTAYSFEIKGEDGEGGRNVQRALGAVVLAGLGLGAFALRRRFI
ncbi:hypothetical protein [Nocardioides sp. Soil796]|uniref:hypothetical protein n=1 Tax=Nocardioides sp. Soil796 TaxID=1736412 RepID=UPI00070DFFAD|nr:hypothetical protein [Nocardioides sp. Soil796]KRF16052.1 hypothetical protein ASH02_05475 [Nocardioides sp. Soil796]